MSGGLREFNILVAGVGGQGVLTLAGMIADAAFKAGYDVKTTEIHGLSQRYGSVPVHVRFGRKIGAPTLTEGSADLIVGLEPLEALRASVYGSGERTVAVVDDYRVVPISAYLDGKRYPSDREIERFMSGFAREVTFLKASEAAEEEGGDRVMANIFMLGYVVARGLLPLSKELVVSAVKEGVRERFWERNLRVFDAGFEAGKKRPVPQLVR